MSMASVHCFSFCMMLIVQTFIKSVDIKQRAAKMNISVVHSNRRAIRAAFKNKQRGALLTTHYMEEAEAVCDRVAIMVSGQLR